MPQEKFIELNREFYPLQHKDSAEDRIPDNTLNTLSGAVSGAINWPTLLKEHRAVILSEAGSGKTEELRQAAIQLRNNGKRSFFIRLEHIVTDFDSAFEEGTNEGFKAWLDSSDEAWILLDSIDEARLKGPIDFEASIRKIGNLVARGLQRSHIILTGRTHAWRPKSDLAYCEKHLPFDQGRVANHEEGSDASSNRIEGKEAFKIYSLKDLTKEQVSIFIKAKDLDVSDELIDGIERQDAWAFATRPQDLEELIEYWKKNKKIGSRSELIAYSIACRLQERDQMRAETASLSEIKAEEGSQQLAACTSFMHESTIGIPDGAANLNAIKVTEVLPEWSEKECQTLLGRPIFDEAIYGTVRFHHRSAREYLTARWLAELLKKTGSRKRIENLFFRNQYGVWVIPPSTRPILEWLILWDEKIRERAWKIQPEIILTCGDPTLFPQPIRVKALESVCVAITEVHSYNGVPDRMAIQRFAQANTAGAIKTLIQQHAENDEVVQFLLEMVWRGQLTSVLPEAKRFSLNNSINLYTRIVAIRIMIELGSPEDFKEILESLTIQSEVCSRRLLGELVSHLEIDKSSVIWLLKVIKTAEDAEEYHVDMFSHALEDYVHKLSPELASQLLQGFGKLLMQQPFIERSYCKISQKYSWLINSSIKIIQNLIIARHSAAKSASSFYILANFKALTDYQYREIKSQLAELVPQWPELNHELFWYGISEARRVAGKEKRITSFWNAWHFGQLWQFGPNDFMTIIHDIERRPLLDDKLVALSLAFRIYQENERPRQWRVRLKKAVIGISELEQQLANFFKPPAQSDETKKWKRLSKRWERESKERKLRDANERAEWREKLKANLGWLDNNEYNLKGQITGAQHGLHNCMREHKHDSSHWAGGNWEDLIEEFGEEVATAFRNGMVAFWRHYKPAFRSEKDAGNSTSFYIIFGLSGLEIESREILLWPSKLTEDEAELAFRYAFHELNGFPNWFHKLFDAFPEVGKRVLLQEIGWELRTGNEEQERHYLLSTISWSYQWLWPHIANTLYAILKNETPNNIKALDYILKIIQGSNTITDSDLDTLAAMKCHSLYDPNHAPYWFATWIGVDPTTAIPYFSTYLSNQGFEIAKNIAMRTAVQLLGERRSESSARENFKIPEHLKDLYNLIHQYVRIEEDIHRAGKGVYSPILRDDAQDARNRLFSMLTDIPGKAAYLAQMELAGSHPAEQQKAWMLKLAKSRAQKDAESTPWSVQQFCEFRSDLERTPRNHRELYDLAIQRLLDFKHDCEEGDNSNAQILMNVTEETHMRNYIAGWCRDRAVTRYSVPQEDELADAKRPDIRFYGVGFDAPVPIELKLVDNNWSGSKLFERLKTQLCEDYLRDSRSNCGIFLLIYQGKQHTWVLPETKERVNFEGLVKALKQYWRNLSASYTKIESIEIMGIDLTKRSSK